MYMYMTLELTCTCTRTCTLVFLRINCIRTICYIRVSIRRGVPWDITPQGAVPPQKSKCVAAQACGQFTATSPAGKLATIIILNATKKFPTLLCSLSISLPKPKSTMYQTVHVHVHVYAPYSFMYMYNVIHDNTHTQIKVRQGK